MVLAFTIPNQNPVLGPAQGNKQEISVYDPNLGNHRSLVATPEDCDKFVNDRNDALEKDNKRTLKTWLYSTLAGLGIGGAAGAIKAKKDAKTVNALIDTFNAELKNGKKYFDLKIPNKYSFEIKFLYEQAKNSFNKLGIKDILKGAGIGGVAGAVAAFTIGLLASIKNSSKSTDQVTQEFIAQHK
ncbi:MAG: hypothetical protein E7Z93_02190 [Cyanobacteria bacterium SIG32]|nr:hypothetical protein [Cyanobacteria bacterium SIG32]